MFKKVEALEKRCRLRAAPINVASERARLIATCADPELSRTPNSSQFIDFFFYIYTDLVEAVG